MDSYAVTIGQGVDGAAFRASVGQGPVGSRTVSGVEASVFGPAEVGGEGVDAAVVTVAVDLGVPAFVDGAAMVGAVVEGREVVSRTTGDVVACGACVAVFATGVEIGASAERPGIVGRVVCAAVGAEADALTAGDAPPVGINVAA